MTTRRSLLVLLVALVASTPALGSPGLGAQAGCDEPYPAIYAGRTTVSPTFGFSQVFPAEPVEPPVLSPPIGGDEVSGFFEIGGEHTLVYVTDLTRGPFRVPVEIADLPEDARTDVIEADGREYLVLSRFESIAGRPVGFLVLWDLDDPCRQLAPVSSTTTAVDASTVPATDAEVPCAPPYAPMWVEHHSGPSTPPPQWPPYPHDRPFDVLEVGTAGGPRAVAQHPEVAAMIIDTDGDGVADAVTEEPGGSALDHVVRIDRADGTIRLHTDIVEFDGAGRNVRPVGDLDRDGRSEVLIGSYLVAGTLRPGQYDVAAVGVALPSGAVEPAGDQDGDGTDDLVVGTSVHDDGTSHVVDGQAALAPGPGGVLGDLGPISVPGRPVASVDVGEGPPAVGIASSDELTLVHGSEAVRHQISGTSVYSDVGVVAFEGRRYLSFSSMLMGPAYRGTFSFWDLDDPCRRLANTAPSPPPTSGRADCLCAPPVPGRPPAQPATPVRAAPAYAG